MTDLIPAPLLAGALSGVALADVLQLLELGARSGMLVVHGGPLGGGSVWLRNGRVVAAAADRPEVANADDHASVVATLLDLSVGRWAFHAAEASEPVGATHAALGDDGARVGVILMDAARRRDERARAVGRPAPPESDVPRLADPEGQGGKSDAVARLTASDLAVLAAVDGVRDVGAIAAAVRRDAARVGETIAAMRALGVVAPGAARAYVGAAA